MSSLTPNDWDEAFSFLQNQGVLFSAHERAQLEPDLQKFLSMLLRKNEVLNLTAIRDPKEALWKHIVDSLLLAKQGDLGVLLDWGSGGGLPGIPFSLLLRAKGLSPRVYFLDSVGKKLAAIREFCQELGIKSEFFHERGELFLQKKQRPLIQTVCMRAVAPPERAIPWLSHEVPQWIIFLGPRQIEEWKAQEGRLRSLKFRPSFSTETVFPFDLGHRSFLKIESQRST